MILQREDRVGALGPGWESDLDDGVAVLMVLPRTVLHGRGALHAEGLHPQDHALEVGVRDVAARDARRDHERVDGVAPVAGRSE